MRHKKAKNWSPGVPAQVAGDVEQKKAEQDSQEECFSTRLRIKVGPPEAFWSHAKWLALADQALLD